MKPEIDKQELRTWLEVYLKHELLRLNPRQFDQYLTLRGFSATESEHLSQIYKERIQTNESTKR